MTLPDRVPATASQGAGPSAATGRAGVAGVEKRWVEGIFAGGGVLILAGFIAQLRVFASFGLVGDTLAPALPMGLVTVTLAALLAGVGVRGFGSRGLATALGLGGVIAVLAWMAGVLAALLLYPTLCPFGVLPLLTAIALTAGVPVLLVGLLGGFVVRLLLTTLPEQGTNI
jgi:hypothetical protein